MSNDIICIFSTVSFLAFFISSYISFAWADVRKKGLEAADNKINFNDGIKLILRQAKSQRKNLTFVKWLCMFILSTASTAAIIAVQLQEMHYIFCTKIFFVLFTLIFVCIIDSQTNTIPNILSINLFILRLVFLPFEYIYQRNVFKTLIISSLIGLFVSFLVLYFVHKITKSGFGMGDVKILSSLGFFVGISSVLTTILFAMIVAAILGVILILLKRKSRKDVMPFGPFIFIGFIISVILGVF